MISCDVKNLTDSMVCGLSKHGVQAKRMQDNQYDCGKFFLVWGWRRALQAKTFNPNKTIMLMERGHIHPRFEWTSIGFDGLAGLATYPECLDNGDRFWNNFRHKMKPWRSVEGYVLVMGQLSGDASLHGLDIRKWERDTCNIYKDAGHEVVFRPHPLSHQIDPEGMPIHGDETIEQALEGAGLCVTYTSTSAVEAVLRGVPTVSCHEGSISRPVTSHGLLSSPITPNRSEWASKLAWSQFTQNEMESGFAWECLKGVIPRLA